MKKISVLMPTYNDCKYITYTLDSLLEQSYSNWELIIVDDGSTDSTKEVIEEYIEKNKVQDKFQYHYQTNRDQLNALKNGMQYTTGDYIYILHSDDLLYSKTSFEDFINYEKANPGYDMYMGSSVIINGKGEVTGDKNLINFKRKRFELAVLYQWLGRNILDDFAFFNIEVFKNKVAKSYLTWNMPAWIDMDNNFMQNVKIMPFKMFRYRLDGNNYIDNEIGKQNVLNGELRTAIYLMHSFSIPAYKLQYFIYRVFNKLKLREAFRPIYFSKEEKNKSKIIDFIIKKRFPNGYENNPYFHSIFKFYESQNNRVLKIDKLPEELMIYKGSDMRGFNKLLNSEGLPEFYIGFMKEMAKGFNAVECEKEDVEKIKDILRFFDIDKSVKVLV